MLHYFTFRYAAGTTPWGGSGSSFASFLPQRIDDGYLEVIGFTTASLVSRVDLLAVIVHIGEALVGFALWFLLLSSFFFSFLA